MYQLKQFYTENFHEYFKGNKIRWAGDKLWQTLKKLKIWTYIYFPTSCQKDKLPLYNIFEIV